MGIRDLFKVETLDFRFAPKDEPPEPLPSARPSKWNTPEYYSYGLVFLTIPPLMFKSVYDVSQPSHPEYARYEDLLEPGWIPGRKVDNSDAQYSTFRDNIPYMALLLVFHPLLRRAFEMSLYKNTLDQSVASKPAGGSPQLSSGNFRLQGRVIFDLAFAAVFLLALHGVSAIKVVTILYANFKIATALPRKHVAIATWIFNIGILFANELCRGYPIAGLTSFLLPNTTHAVEKTDQQSDWGGWLDSYGGLVPRWEVLFNITVLRMISFNFDYLWSVDRPASSVIEKKSLDPTTLSEKDRLVHGANPEDYTLANYLAYTLYAPLYLAGPIQTFNAHISQLRHPLPTTSSLHAIMPYATRFLLSLLTMELCLHYLYAVAISKSNPDWNAAYTPFQLSMLGYFNLHIIWLKLLLPWRFFRLWALADGVDPPENMTRCMSNNYSALAFWRGWHRSFNLWIIRYIYVPLGGNRGGKLRAVINFTAVFTFVALWHDINLRLLMWGWLVTLFVLPEVLGMLAFPAARWQDAPEAYRWLCGLGAVGNILMMMAANLVGFAIGVDGLKGMAEGIAGSLGGRVFLLAACLTLFVGAQVMFEVREAEKRRGVNMKC